MSFLKKMKRKQTAPQRKELQRAAKQKARADEIFSHGMAVTNKRGHLTQDTRIAIMLMGFVNTMHYKFGIPQPALSKMVDYINDIDWYLAHSYSEDGKLTNKPSITYKEIVDQIWKEKRYRVDIRVAYDMSDDILVAMVKALVQLEVKLLWIVCNHFPGIGKVKLGQLQEEIHKVEKEYTFEQILELKKKLKDDIRFTFFEISEDTFGPWIWNSSKRRLKDDIVDFITKGVLA